MSGQSIVIVFFIGLGLVTSLLGFYVVARLRRAFALERRATWALLLFIATAFAIGASMRALGRRLDPPWPELFGTYGQGVILATILVAAFLLVIDGVRLAVHLIGRLRRAPEPQVSGEAGGPSMERRDFLRYATAGAVLAGSGSSLYGVAIGRHDYGIVEVPIPIPGLAKSLDGFVIVQISDIHVGTYVGEWEIKTAIELIRGARPDLVVLTGDLVDHDPSFAPLLTKLVHGLQPASRHGVVAIPGNHDYYTGVTEVLRSIERGGGRTLVNAGRVIGDGAAGFALLGIDDVAAPRFSPGTGPDLERALAMVPADLPRIVLAHNPVYFPEAAGKVALQLSGHTHGGQVNMGIRPADLVLPYGYVAGRYEREGSQLYVNRGFGTAGPPARIGAPPEITRIILVAA